MTFQAECSKCSSDDFGCFLVLRRAWGGVGVAGVRSLAELFFIHEVEAHTIDLRLHRDQMKVGMPDLDASVVRSRWLRATIRSARDHFKRESSVEAKAV